MDIRLENFNGKSKKTGKDFQAFKLTIGDYETLLFPTSPMERNYLTKIIENGDI